MFSKQSKLLFNKRVSTITGILVGDELGQVKRIDIPTDDGDIKDGRKASIRSTSTSSSNSDCSRSSTAVVRAINKSIINDTLSPEMPILSIRPFKSHTIASQEDSDDEDDCDSNGRSSLDDTARMKALIRKHEAAAAANAETSVLFLITQKPDLVYVYNSVTESFTRIKFDRPSVLPSNVSLIGSAPIDRNNIAIVYDNGAIFTLNIEKELYSSCMEIKTKAMKLLGINDDTEYEEESNLLMSPRKKRKTDHKSANGSKKNKETVQTPEPSAPELESSEPKTAASVAVPPPEAPSGPVAPAKSGTNKSDKSEFQPNPHFDPNPLKVIFLPPWKSNEITVSTFEVNSNRIAIAGKNLHLKVFDLITSQCIFTAKKEAKKGVLSSHHSTTLVSGITFLGPITPKINPRKHKPIVLTGNKLTATIDTSLDHKAKTCKVSAAEVPSLVATCCKSDPLIRIYDLRSKQRKPVWVISLKDSTFNNDSNPPSFTSITSTKCPLASAVPTQQLIVGTTMGRMIAVELKFNSHSSRQLGTFKGFSGGTVRGICFVPNVKKIGSHGVVSCSLDRFVRIHQFTTGANAARRIQDKFYIKTRPTCVVPIVGSLLLDQGKRIANRDDDVDDVGAFDEEEGSSDEEEMNQEKFGSRANLILEGESDDEAKSNESIQDEDESENDEDEDEDDDLSDTLKETDEDISEDEIEEESVIEVKKVTKKNNKK